MSYTRNFEFRVPPQSGQRQGRFITGADEIVIGAPVVAVLDADENELGLQEVELATGAQAPKPGLSGIAVFEHKGSEGWAGDDPFLTTYSDKGTAPAGQAVQVVAGDTVKIVLRNTTDRTFLNTRDYPGRVMLPELAGATPTVDVGDYLTPGTGDDAGGYWAVTANAANAWAVVVGVDDARGEVEARLLF